MTTYDAIASDVSMATNRIELTTNGPKFVVMAVVVAEAMNRNLNSFQ